MLACRGQSSSHTDGLICKNDPKGPICSCRGMRHVHVLTGQGQLCESLQTTRLICKYDPQSTV